MRQRSRLTLAIAAIVGLIVLVAGGAASQASAGGSHPKPTIVLVHGAFASPAAWEKVANALHNDGYETATPALGLQSVADDVSIVRATLDSIAGEKILVGHSYGGFVISNAALGRTDVLGLVYTAAYVPDDGESIQGLNAGFSPPAFLAPGHLVFAPSFPDVIIDPQHFRDDFAQDLNPKLAAELAAAQHPTSLAILGSTSGPGAWHSLPSWYAVSGADRVIDPDLQRFMARRAGSTVVTFEDASHAGGFTHYAARFVKLIEEAVHATTG
ncbi:MAG TPA: alpha/beta hydrolase [Gaiellaceae bacterium]|jgi:pimeloyl-ACP methyl ester carboxylesterase